MKELGPTPYDRIITLMNRLRAECPWDREQSFKSIAPYTIEEAYEVSDAIERGDMEDLKSELGDLLFQVLFHAKIASESDAFDFEDVCNGLVEKMVRRHPHVFAESDKPDWETLKAEERRQLGKNNILDGIALALPALKRAEKLQKRAAKTGFDWPDHTGPLEKISEEMAEVSEAITNNDQNAIEAEIGDVLFSVVNLARKLSVDPEAALKLSNQKFTRRFNYIDENSNADLKTKPLEKLEALWQAAKQSGL